MHLSSARSSWVIRIIWTIIALGLVVALGRALPLSATEPEGISPPGWNSGLSSDSAADHDTDTLSSLLID